MSDRLARQLEQLAALQADTARQVEQLRAELAPMPGPARPRRPRAKVSPPPLPEGAQPTELDRAWARRLLRRKGWTP